MTRRFELCSGPVSWGAPDDRLHLLFGLPTRQEEPTPRGGGHHPPLTERDPVKVLPWGSSSLCWAACPTKTLPMKSILWAMALG